MKLNLKRILFFTLLLCQTAVLQANSLDFYFTVKRFFTPEEQKNYIELAYLIPGNIVKYKEIGKNQFQAQVLVSVDIRNLKEEIIFNHAYVLKSPIYSDNPLQLSNLSDLVNLPIPSDSIKMLVQVLDLNDSSKYFAESIEITAPPTKQKSFLSDVSLISAKTEGSESDLFFKHGQVFTPKFINYYPSEINKLAFYVEAYKAKNVNDFIIKYFISDENNLIIEKYANFKKLSNPQMDVLYAEFDISTLPSGNFYVYAELRSKENELLDRKRMFFQRYNKNKEELDNIDYYELNVINNNFAKKYDLNSIRHHLKALQPLAIEFENAAIAGAIKSDDLSTMQNYFYSFWSKRDSKNPEARWNEYAKKLQLVESEFGNTMIEGYQSSRGRVYLQYGKPKERLERTVNQIGRIELWTYEQIENQGNVQFLFIEYDLYEDPFPLVHSNYSKEIYSKQWADYLKTNNF